VPGKRGVGLKISRKKLGGNLIGNVRGNVIGKTWSPIE
jgi:hypothetical protein